MTRTAVRFGIVGCGRLAELGYVPAFERVASAELVAVADPDPDRRSVVAALVGATSRIARFPDATALVAKAAVDLVIVASPVAAHLADARTCAAAGVRTLVEKPPAPDAAGAAELAAIDPQPWVGFNRRFDLGARRVRAAMPYDGDVDLVLRIAYRRKSWRAHSVRDDALLDLGPHLVDWARWLTASEVMAVSEVELSRDRAACTLALRRGRARIEAACDRPYRELIELRDSDAEVLARHTLGGLASTVRSRVAPGPHPLVSTLAAQLEAVVGAVRHAGRGALADAAEAATVMRVIDAARLSAAENGRRIAVASFMDA